jgi:hypothetical protein
VCGDETEELSQVIEANWHYLELKLAAARNGRRFLFGTSQSSFLQKSFYARRRNARLGQTFFQKELFRDAYRIFRASDIDFAF